MTLRGTAGLVGACLVLAALALSTRQSPHPAPRPVENAPPLLDRPAAEVARIDFVMRGRTLTTLRAETGWVDPAGRPWRSGIAEALVDALHVLRPLFVVARKPARPEEYGLGPPADRLRLLAADGAVLLDLEVGARNPSWTGVYVRPAGSTPVLLVGAVLRWELSKLEESAPRQAGP